MIEREREGEREQKSKASHGYTERKSERTKKIPPLPRKRTRSRDEEKKEGVNRVREGGVEVKNVRTTGNFYLTALYPLPWPTKRRRQGDENKFLCVSSDSKVTMEGKVQCLKWMKLKNTQEDIRKKNTASHGFFLLSKDRICYFSCSQLLLLFDHRSKIGHKSLEHRTHPVNLLLVEEEDFLIPFILRLLCVIPSLLLCLLFFDSRVMSSPTTRKEG